MPVFVAGKYVCMLHGHYPKNKFVEFPLNQMCERCVPWELLCTAWYDYELIYSDVSGENVRPTWQFLGGASIRCMKRAGHRTGHTIDLPSGQRLMWEELDAPGKAEAKGL